jgi:predicted glutamine amidotransferase
MFCLKGEFEEDFPAIFEALQEVARSDPLLHGESHSDGWGYVYYDGSSLVHERQREPVYAASVPNVKSGFVVVHARNAAPGEPLGALNSHPHRRSDRRYELYLAHNGWFDKKKIIGLLGEREANLSAQTDSEFFLELIFTLSGDPRERLETAAGLSKEHDLIKTAMNIFLLGVDRATGSATVAYYTDAKEYSEYVTLYRGRGTSWSGVFSSSIRFSSRFPSSLGLEKVERDKVLEL